MKAPLILRWALAWTALTGRYMSISVDGHVHSGTSYRFDVRPDSVRGWIERNKKRRKAGRKLDHV